MKIITSYDCPPIPVRGADWSAHWDHLGEDGPVGRGETEEAAVRDLLEVFYDVELLDFTVESWKAMKERDALQAKLAKAVEALRPFVDYVHDEYRDANPNAKFVLTPWYMGGGGWIGVEDLIRASTTLAELKG